MEEVSQALGWENVQILQQFTGKKLELVVCSHPFFERDSLVVLGEHVTLDAGTGCVHTAPGHGVEDFGGQNLRPGSHFAD